MGVGGIYLKVCWQSLLCTESELSGRDSSYLRARPVCVVWLRTGWCELRLTRKLLTGTCSYFGKMTAEFYFRLSCTGPTYLKTDVFASSQDQWNSWVLFCWEQITARVSQPNPSKSSREAVWITSSHALYIKANHTRIQGTGDCTLGQVGGHYQLTWERAAAKRSLK